MSQHAGGELQIFASAARTADPALVDQINHNASGVVITIDVTAIVTAPSVVFTIQYKDTLSGKYVDLLVSAARTAVGTTVLRIRPGLTAVANLTVNDVLPRLWRVKAVHANGNSITYSVSANYTQ